MGIITREGKISAGKWEILKQIKTWVLLFFYSLG